MSAFDAAHDLLAAADVGLPDETYERLALVVCDATGTHRKYISVMQAALRDRNTKGAVALVVGESLTLYDTCHAWEAAESYALNEGREVIVVNEDGHTREWIQALVDQSKAQHDDCWGVAM